MYALILIGYWLLFWRKFLRNPYLLCTSEMASTFFPFWRWMGRKWQATDDIYYRYPASIPFLSMWYLPHVITAWLSRKLSDDAAFKVLAYTVIAHWLLGSFIAYKLFLPHGEIAALFGAITLTYAGYCIKPQQPCIAYTLAWMPGMLIGGHFGWISCLFAVTGGYWPILVYFIPVAAIVNPNCLFGLILSLPQIIPFIWYWKKSVRSGSSVERNFGRLNWYRLFDLFIPNQPRGTMNGVQFTEYQMYMGIAPVVILCGIPSIFFSHLSLWWSLLILALMVSVGLLPPLQRIPCRSLYLATFCIALLSAQNFHHLIEGQACLILLIQSYFLIKNSSIYPSFPFSQWWDKPSRLYTKKPKMHNWPYLTGYLKGERISDYQGSFRLRTA